MNKTLDTPAGGSAKPSMLDKLPKHSFVQARDAKVMQVSLFPVAAVEPNPEQPRKRFEKAALDDLAASIKENGLMQPICLRPDPARADHYIIVAGERRWRAHKLLGLDKIPGLIVDGDPDVLAVIENLQREELTPMEEAFALKRLKDAKGYTDEQVGLAVSKKRNTVNEILSITRLPDGILNDVENYPNIGKNALIELAKLSDQPDNQRSMWAAMRQGRVTTVKDARAVARGEKAESDMSAAEKAVKSLTGLTKKITKLDTLSESELAALKKAHRALTKVIKAKTGAPATQTEAPAAEETEIA